MEKTQILIIGCGHGFRASQLSVGSDVIGTDLDMENIEKCRLKYPGLDFRVMNAESLSFEDNTFDYVDAFDVLEHVDNLGDVISEVYRVLKKGGIFRVNVPAEKSEKWLLGIRPTYHAEIHHVRIFKKGEMEAVMEKAGFGSMVKHESRDFLQHFELYFLFKFTDKSDVQLSVGDWRANWLTKIIHVMYLFTHKDVLSTPLKYIPLWIITIPFGYIINLFGNEFFPKSEYYEFKK